MPSNEGGTGTVREQEFALQCQQALAQILRADGRFHVELCPGDIPDGWVGDLFISLHGDGAGPSAHGYSFGWPANGRDPGRGPELAGRLAVEWAQLDHPGGHHSDNYTANMRGYYGWSRTNAPTKVLIEHCFLTNPVEQAWAFKHVADMQQATYRAVLKHFALRPPVKPSEVHVLSGGRRMVGDLNYGPFVTRVAAELRAHGQVLPWVATVNGRRVGVGRLWRDGKPSRFNRRVQAYARKGFDVVLDGTVTITQGDD